MPWTMRNAVERELGINEELPISVQRGEKIWYGRTILTLTAVSENQAQRYRLQETVMGLGNPDSCPWRQCSDQ
jgi:hypothetical protein